MNSSLKVRHSPSSARVPSIDGTTWVKQFESTLIRNYDDFGYIYNRVTKCDRVYDAVGGLYLKELRREPQRIADIAARIARASSGAAFDAVQANLIAVVRDLAADEYVGFGADPKTLDASEPKFSYAGNTLQKRRESNVPESQKKTTDTCDFFFDYFSKKPLLFRVHIDVTSRCNEKCRHCYLPPERSRVDLDGDLALRVLDELCDLRTFSVTFSGGEPFLNPRFPEILRRARANDFAITVLSNGTLLDDRHLDLLQEVQVDEIQFTLFSTDPAEHDFITQARGSHKKTMKNVARVLERDIPLKISCPVMKANRHAYKDVARWAWPLGIDVNTDFVLFACTDFNAQPLDNRLSLAEAEELIRDMIEGDPAYKRFLDFRDPPLDPKTLVNQPCCGAGRDTLCLDANGDFYFCPLFRRKLGNAHHDRVKDLWATSQPICDIRKTSWSNFPKCVECDAFHFCSMCFARNYNEGKGDIFKINEHCCDIAFLNKRLVEEYWNREPASPVASQERIES